jgi:hypothetical protein
LLRGILPVLALVWATLTWHDCYLQGVPGAAPSMASVEHCQHRALLEVAGDFALDIPAGSLPSNCDDVVQFGSDLRPAMPELLAVQHGGFVPLRDAADAAPNGPRAARATTVPPDTPRSHRPARLLI